MSFARLQVEFALKSKEEKERAYTEANAQAAADLVQLPEPLMPADVGPELNVDETGLRWNLFEELSQARSVFPGVKDRWPQGQRANAYVCPLSGLLLFDPLSSQACGDISHYYERGAMTLEQETQQRFRKECNAEPDQFYPPFPPYVWQCPCCESRGVPVHVPASAFSRDDALREEIRRWLCNIRLYLKEMTEQDIDLLAYLFKKTRLRREDIVNDRAQLMSGIEHFLKYGNNKVFLNRSLYGRAIHRATVSVGLVQDGEYRLAGEVSREASQDVSSKIASRCVLS